MLTRSLTIFCVASWHSQGRYCTCSFFGSSNIHVNSDEFNIYLWSNSCATLKHHVYSCCRLIREIAQRIRNNLGFEAVALSALQEGAESYLVQLFEDAIPLHNSCPSCYTAASRYTTGTIGSEGKGR